ncbi:MAG: HEAT repeat domain-containing protein [Planctomycetia bacterium]
MIRPLLLVLTLLGVAAPASAESLDEMERVAVERYLDDAIRGVAGSAAMVDRLSALSWPNLRLVIDRYAELDATADPTAHRRFQTLLERTTRTVLLPASVRELYAADLVRLTCAAADDDLSRKLFARLVAHGNDRRAADLIVRLTPCVSLARLAHDSPPLELLRAWNRRLARGRETRPLPGLDEALAALAAHPPAVPSGPVYEAWLEFLAGWPSRHSAFEAAARTGLAATSKDTGIGTLHVLEKKTCLGEEVAACLERHLPGQPLAEPAVVEAALEVLAADEQRDHAALLRELWPRLPGPPSRAQYVALLAMAVHPRGNEPIALEALRAEPFEFVDPALAVLRQGPLPLAAEAVSLLLGKGDRGHEEALRLVAARRLPGFETAAIDLAFDDSAAVVVRQTAIASLAHATGGFRRRLLPLLGIRNGDLRLATIQCFAPVEGLSADDREAIGPPLIRVAQDDPSDGHRQEAIFALGNWRDPAARPFLEQVLAAHPPVILAEQAFSEAVYWRYRLRLVALVGLARLGDADASVELQSLHRRGGPTEKMDVLLACSSLGECPAWAEEDLLASEPKLLATAARLIARHGSAEQRRRLVAHCGTGTAFAAFAGSGIDDHQLLKFVQEAAHADGN